MKRVILRLPIVAGTVLLANVCLEISAFAQDAPPAPPPTAAAPTAAPASSAPAPAPVAPLAPSAAPPTAPPPVTAPVVPPPAPPAAEAPSAAATPPPPPAPAPIKPGITTNFFIRVGGRLENRTSPQRIDGVNLDTVYVEPHFGGALTDYFSWTANFNAGINGGGLSPAASVGIMDLIAQFKAADEFNVWAGRLLVPSDRSNFSGPFFMSPWNYPGFYVAGAPLGPIDNATGRDNGAVVWGDFGKGKFKYYVGAFGMDQTSTPYFSARLNLAVIGSEPGFYHSSTYYGSQNILALGAAVQYQHDGSSDPVTGEAKDTVIGMADVLAEAKLGGAGVLTGEAQFYKFNDGYSYTKGVLAPAEAFYVLASYLTPDKVGIGKIQPLVRVQRQVDSPTKNDATIIDADVTYVINDYNLRMVVGYQRNDSGTSAPAAQNVHFGIQLIK